MNYIKRILKKSKLAMRMWRDSEFLRSIPIREWLFLNKIFAIIKAQPYSYTPMCYPKLSTLYNIALTLEKEGISGDFVQCGVWRGSSAAVVSKAFQRNVARHSWLFDSWDKDISATLATEQDVSRYGESLPEVVLIGSEDKARELIFQRFRLSKERIHIVRGWFEETLPAKKNDVGNIAFLHLDCDWYESIKTCLEIMYENVVEGGFIYVDGYKYWVGCKRAVDSFLKEIESNAELKPVSHSDSAIYFRK